MSAAPVPQPAQLRTLYRAFLARFFENEITSGTHDLKASFIWLIAFLAAPGFILPVMLVGWDWEHIRLAYGGEVLRQISTLDRFTYVAMGMVASGIIGALVWQSVLIDRRDTLILGVLPVRGAVIVTAKLLSLAAYVAVIAASMHVLAAITFGTMLASTAGGLVRGVAAHFLASFAASGFVLLAIVAAQAVLLASAGARRFRRLSSWLQAGLVFGVLVLTLSLPSIARQTHQELAFPQAYRVGYDIRVDVAERPPAAVQLPVWLEAAPPVWFLGLYEVLLGTDMPVFERLGRRAMSALAATVLITLVVYPVAYRRVMVASVEQSEGLARTRRWSGVPGALVARIAGRDSTALAAAQFFTATLARVDRHRFVLAGALGAALAWGVPGLLRWIEAARTPVLVPEIGILAVPFWTMLCVTLGLRVAASLPSEPGAGWMFAMADASDSRVWAAVRRFILGICVLPVVCLTLVGVGWLWGLRLALTTSLLALAVGVLFVEILVWRGAGMPCSRAWAPQRANLRLWWPMYLAGIFWVAALPHLAILLSAHPGATAVVLAGIAGVTVLVRLAARSPLTLGADEPRDDDAAFQTLKLQ